MIGGGKYSLKQALEEQDYKSGSKQLTQEQIAKKIALREATHKIMDEIDASEGAGATKYPSSPFDNYEKGLNMFLAKRNLRETKRDNRSNIIKTNRNKLPPSPFKDAKEGVKDFLSKKRFGGTRRGGRRGGKRTGGTRRGRRGGRRVGGTRRGGRRGGRRTGGTRRRR